MRFKLARHIVRSEPAARVLVVNVELCTLHLKETTELEKMLSFCCGATAARPRSSPPSRTGCARQLPRLVAPETRGLMTWNIRDAGFDMLLSGAGARAPSRRLVATCGGRCSAAQRR